MIWIFPQIYRKRSFSPQTSLIPNVHFRLRVTPRTFREASSRPQWGQEISHQSNFYSCDFEQIWTGLTIGIIKISVLRRSRQGGSSDFADGTAIRDQITRLFKGPFFGAISLNLYRVFLGFALFPYINTLAQCLWGHSPSTRGIVYSFARIFCYFSRRYSKSFPAYDTWRQIECAALLGSWWRIVPSRNPVKPNSAKLFWRWARRKSEMK